ncbi:MAG: ABC transporter ATP-binding protein, partial [Sneathiella sp.]
AMAQMDVDVFASRPFKMLSGGEQARVLIARALAQQTDLLFADEPLAGLDPAHQISLMQRLKRIVQEGRTVILSLHELTLAARWCDRLLLLQNGVLAKDGLPETVLETQTLKSAFGVGGYISVHSNKPLIIPLELEEGGAHDK